MERNIIDMNGESRVQPRAFVALSNSDSMLAITSGIVCATMPPIGNGVYFISIGAAAAVYGFRKEIGRAKLLLVVSGILMAVVFVYLLYEFVSLPSIYGGNLLTYGYVAVSYILGLGIYLASKMHYSRRGIDISLAFKELPPD